MKLLGQVMQVLNDDEMEQIKQAAIRVWARVPMRIPLRDDFIQPLLDFGCRVEGEQLWFPEEVRAKTLARIEAQRAANGPARPSWNVDQPISVVTNAQGFYCADLETNELRLCTTHDLQQWSWVCDAIPGMSRAHPTFIPQDVPLAGVDAHTFATVLTNSRMPVRVSVYEADMLPYFIEMQAVRDGSRAAVMAAPIFAAKTWENSPFNITAEAVDIGLKAREMGLPFIISCMPTAGSAAPVTLAGTLVQCAAEVFANNAIVLALDDRINGWSASPPVTDMRSGNSSISGPDYSLLWLAYSQFSAYLFGGEYHAGSALQTMAAVPGVQSVMEKCLNGMWGLWGGLRSFSSMGVLAASDAAGLTQMALDLEIVSWLERLLEGVAVDAETLAEDVIAEVAPRGAYYLGHDHTAQHFRKELWLAELVDRRPAAAWRLDPTDLVETARNKARRMAEAAENQCPLSEEQKRQIMAIAAEARAKALEKQA
jgi:trimethylamine---corrinoid protein Co-methyltransferase